MKRLKKITRLKEVIVVTKLGVLGRQFPETCSLKFQTEVEKQCNEEEDTQRRSLIQHDWQQGLQVIRHIAVTDD